MNAAELMAGIDKWSNMWALPLPKGSEHLVYKDFPKMPIRVWEFIIAILTPFELKVLAYSTYDNDTLARGQVFVHPDGMVALEKAIAEAGDALFADETIKH
jgi:hypothetical protein